MPHYTLLSGKRTDTITSRCPICCKVRYYTPEEAKQFNLLSNPSSNFQICCSLSHYELYEMKVGQFWRDIVAWYIVKTGKLLVPTDTADFEDIISLYFAEAHMQ